MPVEYIADRGAGYPEIQLEQFTFDLAVPPSGILLSDSDDQVLNLLTDPWSATFALVGMGPLASHQLSMPAQYGLRLENAHDFTQLIRRITRDLFQLGKKNRQRQFFGTGWTQGFIKFALQNGQLVT